MQLRHVFAFFRHGWCFFIFHYQIYDDARKQRRTKWLLLYTNKSDTSSPPSLNLNLRKKRDKVFCYTSVLSRNLIIMWSLFNAQILNLNSKVNNYYKSLSYLHRQCNLWRFLITWYFWLIWLDICLKWCHRCNDFFTVIMVKNCIFLKTTGQ